MLLLQISHSPVTDIVLVDDGQNPNNWNRKRIRHEVGNRWACFLIHPCVPSSLLPFLSTDWFWGFVTRFSPHRSQPRLLIEEIES